MWYHFYPQQWEDQLVNIQDILDALIKCQITWLYLEPIFSSADIIAQMPVEGRKFGIVDGYWKNIMAEAVESLWYTGCLFIQKFTMSWNLFGWFR